MQRSITGLKPLLLYTMLCCMLFFPSALRAEPAPVQLYQRKDISFYQEQSNYPLNPILAEQFKTHLPRFDYHLLSSTLDVSLLDYLKRVRQYQHEQAAKWVTERRPMSESERRFGSHVVTLSETQDIMKSAIVMSAYWHFSPIELSGPRALVIRENDSGEFPQLDALPPDTYFSDLTKWETRRNPETQEEEKVQVQYKVYFELPQTSTLTLRLRSYRLHSLPPELYSTFAERWFFSHRDTQHIVRQGDLAQANALLRRRGEPEIEIQIDTDEDYTRSTLFQGEALKEIPRFRTLAQADPETLFLPQARQRLSQANSFEELWMQLKGLEAFQLVGLVAQPSTQRATIDMGPFETPERLRIHLRDTYILEEWALSEKGSTRRNFGFGRVRGFSSGDLELQPLNATRPLELGDMVREYPMWGYSFHYGLQSYAWDRGFSVMGVLFGEWFLNTLDASSYLEAAQRQEQRPENYSPHVLNADESSILFGLGLGNQFTLFIGPQFKQFWGPWGWTYGAQLQYFAGPTPEGADEEVGGLALLPQTGLIYAFSPHLALDISTGWRLSLPLEYSGPMLQISLNNQW